MTRRVDDVGLLEGAAHLALPFVVLYLGFRAATAGVRDALAGGRS